MVVNVGSRPHPSFEMSSSEYTSRYRQTHGEVCLIVVGLVWSVGFEEAEEVVHVRDGGVRVGEERGAVGGEYFKT